MPCGYWTGVDESHIYLDVCLESVRHLLSRTAWRAVMLLFFVGGVFFIWKLKCALREAIWAVLVNYPSTVREQTLYREILGNSENSVATPPWKTLHQLVVNFDAVSLDLVIFISKKNEFCCILKEPRNEPRLKCENAFNSCCHTLTWHPWCFGAKLQAKTESFFLLIINKTIEFFMIMLSKLIPFLCSVPLTCSFKELLW